MPFLSRVSLFLLLGFVVSSAGADLQDPPAKIINRHPLKIVQVFSSPLQKENHSLLSLEVQLAPKHKAYADAFKVVSPKKENFDFSELEINPLHPFIDKFSHGKERLVVEDQATIKLVINNSKVLNSEASLALTYQACTKDYCLLPQDLNFKVKLHPSSAPSPKKKGLLANLQSKPPALILILIFLFGFLTAFTPCVFPMIPITMGILGFSAGAGRWRGFLIGLFYSLGLALTYALVGLFAALSGSFIGKAFTNPYIIWGIFLFYVFTALAMMGVFTIKSPAFIDRSFSKVNAKGLLGALLTGCIAGVIASPCVGPAVAAVVTYVAQKGNPLYGFTALFSFGMGLGSLFIIIGAFYGELNSRLKPGKWMSYVKYVLAFLILLGAFLFIKPHLPFFSSHSPNTHSPQKDSLWETYSSKAYAQYLQNGDQIIIDFRADWCSACEELEEYTFSTEGFKEATQNIRLLKFDATKPNAAQEKELKKFNVFGLPTVLFIDAQGKVREDLTLTGFEEWPDLQERIKALKTPN